MQKNISYLFTLFTYIEQTFKNDNAEDQLLPNMSWNVHIQRVPAFNWAQQVYKRIEVYFKTWFVCQKIIGSPISNKILVYPLLAQCKKKDNSFILQAKLLLSLVHVPSFKTIFLYRFFQWRLIYPSPSHTNTKKRDQLLLCFANFDF